MKKAFALAALIIATVLILSIITLAMPPGILAGEEAYYHVMAANPGGQGSFVLSQYDYFLKIAFLFFEPILFMKIFPIVLGALCVLLFYLAAEKFLKEKSALYASIIFILSPCFLYIFSANSAEIISLFLLLLGIFLLVQKDKYLSYSSIVPFVFSAISSMFVAVLVFIIYITYFLAKREKRYDFIAGTALIILAVLFLNPAFMIDYSLSNLPVLSNLFSDFGGLAGISIFAAIFFIAGLIAMKKREYSYPIIIYLVVSFLMDHRTIIYSNILVSCFAGLGLRIIIEKKWELNNLKQILNFLLIGGLLFSAVSHINVIKNIGPSQELMGAAQWISKNSEKNSVVLSSPSNSILVEYSGRNAMISALPSEMPKFNFLMNDANEIYYSRNLEKTEKLLNKYNVNYILIDGKMLEGGIWKKSGEGLLFLLTNQEKFPIVYNQGGVKIAYYSK